MLCCLCCSLIQAQSTYNGVTITRSSDNVNVILVTNSNQNPVLISLKYALGSRQNPEWRRLIYNGSEYIRIEAGERNKEFSVSSKIYGLDLDYVKILQEVNRETTCDMCGGRGWITVNGEMQSCICGGSGPVAFPEATKR